MTANEMLALLNQLNNNEKNVFLNELYEEYFRVASDEQLLKDAKILQKYYDGELVEVETDGY